ncbi:hypothetical protein ACFL4A_04315, partial [bacterium]
EESDDDSDAKSEAEEENGGGNEDRDEDRDEGKPEDDNEVVLELEEEQEQDNKKAETDDEESSVRGEKLPVLIQNAYQTFDPIRQSVKWFLQLLGNKSEESIAAKPEIKQASDMFAELASTEGLGFRVQKLKVAHASIETREGKKTFVASRRLLRVMAILVSLIGLKGAKDKAERIVQHEIGEKALINEGKSKDEAHRIMMAKDPVLQRFENQILPAIERLYDMSKSSDVLIQSDLIQLQKDMDIIATWSNSSYEEILKNPNFVKLRTKILEQINDRKLIKEWTEKNFGYKEYECRDGMVVLIKFSKNENTLIDIQVLKAPIIDIEILEAVLGANPVVRTLRRAYNKLGKSMNYVRKVYLPILTKAASAEDLRATLQKYEAVEKDLRWVDVKKVRFVERAV